MAMDKTFLVAGFMLGAYAVASPLGATDLVPTEKLPTQAICMTCHGPTGDSTKDSVPRLNGQHVEYLRKRLNDFHDPGSQDPHAIDAMWGIVEKTDDQTLAQIADYYARQPPTPATAGPPLAEAGRRLYVTGDPANNIAACASCHGAHGEGRAGVPRLAGQHALYLKNQLERMRFNLRASAVMHPNTNSMSNEQIEAVVAYLAGD
jgi:cytochrome c553